MPDVQQMQPDQNPDAAEAANKRERLRFSNFKFSRTQSGQCAAEVELEFSPGSSFVGRADGQSSTMGDLRIAADAAIRALSVFSEGELEFELIGVKTVRAFDANLIIVSVVLKDPVSPARLLGAYLADGDMARGAALAVLNATNRILGNFIATR
jgi:hypothetical protein